MTCNKCQEKGHIAKYCKKKCSSNDDPGETDSRNTNTALSCMVLIPALNSSVSINKNSWILDFGCTQHICNDKSIFKSLDITDKRVLFGNNAKSNVKLVGVIDAMYDNRNLCFSDVLYSPGLAC